MDHQFRHPRLKQRQRIRFVLRLVLCESYRLSGELKGIRQVVVRMVTISVLAGVSGWCARVVWMQRGG